MSTYSAEVHFRNPLTYKGVNDLEPVTSPSCAMLQQLQLAKIFELKYPGVCCGVVWCGIVLCFGGGCVCVEL